MSIEHRPDPNNFAGAEARRASGNERAKRLAEVTEKPFSWFMLGIVIKTAAVFAVGGLLFWLLSQMRGY